MPGFKDYYKILGLEQNAAPDEIKQAYRHMAKKYHPDINKAPDAHERFIEITEAYEILMNRDLHQYYVYRDRSADQEHMRAQYERARKAAQEAARKYARMKFEKFKQEQEAFKKSGWHDLILFLRYFMRILVFPLIGVSIALPLISEEVTEHPSGYVIFWLIALALLSFVINNRKNYFRIDSFYYHFSDIGRIWSGVSQSTEHECYYCPGHAAMKYPYKIFAFKIKKIQLHNYGALYARRAGMSRDIKTIRIPRSRKAFIFHSLASLLKIALLVLSLVFMSGESLARFSFPVGLLSGGLLSGLLLYFSGTRSKVSYLLSYGMIIKLFAWFALIWYFGRYAFIFLFFDPMLEAILRFFSGDRLFIPLTRQYPELDKLFHNKYQIFMELPVLSIIGPLFKWLF